MAEVEKELTYGQKAVGFTFNPSGDATVQKLKQLYAEIIDVLDPLRNDAVSNGDKEKARVLSIAITEAQTAQMWAVKGQTWPTNAPNASATGGAQSTGGAA